MANELAVAYKANDGQTVELDAASVQKYILSGSATATDAEIAGFLAVCKARGLNPMAKDAYLVKYGSGPASVIVSKDYFMRTACQDPDFDGFKAGVVIAREGRLEYREGAMVGKGEPLVGGWAEVYHKGRRVPVRAEVAFTEYATGKSLWASKPGTMVRKVALVQALREAFPAKFGGLYDSAEMPPAPVAAQDVQQQNQPQPQPQQQPAAAPAVPKLNQAQAGDLMELCSEAAQACGMPVDEMKRTVWCSCRWQGEDWAEYMAKARRVATDVCERHMSMGGAEYYEGEPAYEC